MSIQENVFGRLDIDPPPFRIGNTPISIFEVEIKGVKHKINIKEEKCNEFGSIKDRIAWVILSRAIKSRTPDKDTPIVDASSGNYGYALASMCQRLGRPAVIVSTGGITSFNRSGIENTGAVLQIAKPLPGESTNEARIRQAGEYAEACGGIFLNQYSNRLNPETHAFWTAPETLSDGAFDACFVGSSSGGTVSGFAHFIDKTGYDTELVLVEPYSSCTYFEPDEKHAAPLTIPGFGSQRKAAFGPLAGHVEVMRIADTRVLACFTVLRKRQLADVGLSGSALILGALQWLAQQNEPKEVICVCADGPERYVGEFDQRFADQLRDERFGPFEDEIQGFLGHARICEPAE